MEIIKSKYYQHDDELMMTLFGTLTPSTHQRAEKFFELWCSWRDNRVKLNSIHKKSVRRYLNSIGLTEMQDFQIKGAEVRFKNTEDLAFLKIYLSENTHV